MRFDPGSLTREWLSWQRFDDNAPDVRALIEAVDCSRFLLSTNGSRHGHPDPESIARILKFGSAGPKTLYFNCRQDYATPWNQMGLREAYDYTCCFPSAAVDGRLTIEI